MFIMLTVLLQICKMNYNSLFFKMIWIYDSPLEYFIVFGGLGRLAT